MTTHLPDRYFVVGHPVEHSLSPSIHAAFARQTGQDLVYGRCLCPLDGFETTVRALAADHAAGRVRGCNVTIPFKFEAAALARECSARARLAGAANVLCFDAEGWFADNTDGIGLMADLRRNRDTLAPILARHGLPVRGWLWRRLRPAPQAPRWT